MEVTALGQVFTPGKLVTKILSLRKFFGNVLEPSAGEGAFLTRLENFTAIEYDKNLKKHY